MLHVILHILAVIGIIILCILGLVLCLLLLVLFVPLRYQVSGRKDAQTLMLRFKLTYLLHLVSVSYAYPEPGNVVFRIFGIPVYRMIPGKSTEQAKEKKTSKADKPKNMAAESGATEEKEITEKEITEKQAKEAVSEERFSEDKISEERISEERLSEETEAEDADAPEKKTLAQKISDIWEKIKFTIRKIYDKIKNIIQGAQDGIETVRYYRDTLTKKENLLFYARIKRRVFAVLRSIRPRKMKADLRIGTGSPDSTGYLCAAYGMLLPYLGKNVNMQADFEEKILEGEGRLKGRITVWPILWQALKVFFDRRLRRFLKEIKREAK